MIISYFDSSLILSILFNESHAEEALDIWKNCHIRVSSILLKFETNISVRRRYKSQHLAAALKISEKYNRNQIRICSFDNNMRNLAQQLGFTVNNYKIFP